MAGILVFVEQRDGTINKASQQALSEAKRHGGAVTAVVAGSGITDAAAGLGAFGAEKVFVADDANLALYSSEGYAEAVVKAAEQASPTAIFFAGTAMGRDLAPRVAARLGVGALADVVDLTVDGESFSARRPVYSGKAFATATTGYIVEGAGPDSWAATTFGAESLLAQGLGWSNFFLLCTLFALPGMVLLHWVAPWHGEPEPNTTE